jgi:DNA-binding LytR/AlgR family response regulator
MINCIIVDDEEMSIRIIRNYLEKVKGIAVAGVYYNALDAFAGIQAQQVDLMFLDIQMPEVSGLHLLRSLSKPPPAILTTAHREFALESYDLNVVDYLLKPFSLERFLSAIDKFMQRNRSLHEIVQMPAIAQPPMEEPPFVYIKIDRQFVKVLLDDIYYIESLRNHVRLFTAKGPLITHLSISEMEEKLPPQRFLRIHRSYIAAIGKIEQFSQSSVIVQGQVLPIGDLYKSEVMRKLNRNLLE